MTYTPACENCGVTHETDSTEEERIAEEIQNSGEAVATRGEKAMVCDDCYDAFMAWWETLPQEQKDSMAHQVLAEAE